MKIKFETIAFARMCEKHLFKLGYTRLEGGPFLHEAILGPYHVYKALQDNKYNRVCVSETEFIVKEKIYSENDIQDITLDDLKIK